MALGNRAFDTRLQHRAPASAAMTATTTLDTQQQRDVTYTEFETIVYVEAIDVANGDETYTVVVELSDDNFATVKAECARIILGDATQLAGDADTAVGDKYRIMWHNEWAGVVYRDWRVRVIIAGTSPSITLNSYSTC